MGQDQVLLTVEQAAARLQVGRTRAYVLISSGALESVTIGRSRRVPVAALERYVAQLQRSQDTL